MWPGDGYGALDGDRNGIRPSTTHSKMSFSYDVSQLGMYLFNDVCVYVCIVCVNCQLNERSIHDSLVNIPPHITKSDLHALIFFVLSCLVSFHFLLDKNRQVSVLCVVCFILLHIHTVDLTVKKSKYAFV